MKLVLASGNAGKLAEFRELFAGTGFDFHPQSEFAIDDVEETGLTFVENALIKARHAARISGLPALGDDSGLCVDALDGAPGLYSARYAGSHGDSAANIEKLLREIHGVPDDQRTARFVCVLALLRHADDPQPIIAQGTWEGRILDAPRGDNGFGYDPVFVVPGLGLSAAELDSAAKHRLSHRGQAMARLHELLQPQ
ncbi:RdgB/HAM1 family non-canonical purine NTP pyrophosphatase [Solilutibacter silvestris]|uniref:dITP/XTP pyrophosphatase n=1 Tax=Solilutibacter silvestris TaxID=1645665 RepID=A0A2K1Q022_9GAMM|nr:RdgB/HAM1 family non-canonical purine NTP pyrophosphatase [Lysobacter silvestris]PNS08391.1 non-canonical purine NTP pyrophosphatase, RdgB/HAM1 family [Lysobacter silvestris]